MNEIKNQQSTINNPRAIDNPKILIIDDEPDILRTLGNILTTGGFQVRKALNGVEAIEIFKAESFDLVITDIRMPWMDGLEVMKQIKQLDEDMGVIILTGFASIENAVKALRNNGAYDYLTKPLENIDELIITVNNALERRRLQIANKSLVKELKQTKEYLEHLLATAGDVIFTLDIEGRVTYINCAIEEYGYSRNELTGTPLEQFLIPYDPDDSTRKGITWRPNETFEVKFKEKSGHDRYASIRTSLLNDRIDGRSGLLGIMRDITENKQIEMEMDALQILHEAIVEGVPVGIALLDNSFRNLFSNQELARILHLGNENLIGKHIEYIFGDELKQKLNLDEKLAQVLKGQIAVDSEQSVSLEKQIINTIVDIRYIPLSGAENQTQYILVIVEDISKRMQMEKEIRRLDRLSSLGELSAGIAHEVRNPLTGINSNAQLLYESVNDNEFFRKPIENILIGVKRIDKIVSDVLNFARPKQTVLSRCALNEIVSHTVRLFASECRQKKVRIEMKTAGNFPDLNLDISQIEQVLINLILNALQATPEGGKIMLNLSLCNEKQTLKGESGQFIELSISDNGSGMAPDVLDKIFDPFFSLRSDGTGLGLSISHTILTEHNVGIEVNSKPGEGTTFSLMFPVD